MPAARPRSRLLLAAALAAALLAALLATAVVVAPPASAESACTSDPAGDVQDRASRTTVDEPRADILAVCATHTAEQVQVAVRLAAPTDPATSPAWDNEGTAIGVAVDLDGDGSEDIDLNYRRFPDGQARVEAYDHESGDRLCTGGATFDGVRYLLSVPRACLGNPTQISIAPFIFFESSIQGQANQGFYDEVPPRPQFLGPYTTADDPSTAVERLAGASRVDTAVAVSQDDFGAGAAQAVVLARADLFPDALVAAPLAVAVDGPVLLTANADVPDQVVAEIQRVLPTGRTVHLTGGPTAIGEAVRTELEGLGYEVQRLSGQTRYETAVAVARAAVPDPQVIVVADGNTFPNALVGGSLAAFQGGVEVLTNGAQLDASAQAYLAEHPDAEVVAVGATAAQAVPGATPIGDGDPFATAVAVAGARYPGATGAALASGTNFPDGLTGGAHAARAGIPLLLSTPDVLSPVVADHLAAEAPLARIVIYGGLLALSHQVERDAATALG